MKFFKNIFPLALLIAFSATASAQYLEYTATDASKLWFDGTSTLHDFTCHANEIKSEVVFSAELLDGTAGTAQQGEIIIPVEQIKHDNDGLTKNMYKTLEPKKYPQITFVWNSIELTENQDENSTINATVHGDLTVKDQTRDITIPVEIKGLANADTLQVVGNYPLFLSNFDIEQPSFFLGTLKVGDEFNIKFDMTFARTNNYEELTQR